MTKGISPDKVFLDSVSPDNVPTETVLPDCVLPDNVSAMRKARAHLPKRGSPASPGVATLATLGKAIAFYTASPEDER
jgi:hypothetical protein